ncbi:hypothetical protein LSTR_LSTR009629 [Laodelphax striatellus]|uniref:Leucine-rich repeat-containing protein 34 n=1 Tax=Laodelphax striatellus TaxID=195883 RepID=A0A482WNB6_LAOST|nr:hypothetical protein LSTR_LSTR009629 [Laodelphax striatellus]
MYNITELFIECMYERNVDRTINLILHGHKLERNNRNRILSTDVELICNHLRNKSNIVALQLCYNSIGDEGATKLAEFLKDCRSIKYLDLRMNGIGAEGVKSFLDVAEYLTIKSLNLAGNKIGKQGGIYISELIKVNEELQHIDLAETDQTSTSIAYLLSAINEKSTLKNFNLSRVVPHPGKEFDVDNFIDLLSRVLSMNSTLCELHLQKIHLTCHQMDQLCDGLRWMRSLEMLDLSSNLIGDEGSKYLSEYLIKKPPLKALNLSHNRIANRGADSLSRSLLYSDVKYLDLSFNQIKDGGIQFLLFSIPKYENKRLKLLFLRGNEIKNQETLAVLQTLIESKIINSETCDLMVYQAPGDQTLSLAHNQTVDIFREEYYSVSKEYDNFKQRSIREKNARKHMHFVSSWPMPLSIIPEFGTPFLD